jgi:TPR repeat protein
MDQEHFNIFLEKQLSMKISITYDSADKLQNCNPKLFLNAENNLKTLEQNLKLVRGLSYYKNEKYSAARKSFTDIEHPIAYMHLGYIYENGLKTETDTCTAYKYYTKALNLGYLKAAENIIKLFASPQHIYLNESYKKDTIENLEKYVDADATLLYYCGILYQMIGTFDKAYNCYQLCMQKKSKISNKIWIDLLVKLGDFYQQGYYVKKNIDLSLMYYQTVLDNTNVQDKSIRNLILLIMGDYLYNNKKYSDANKLYSEYFNNHYDKETKKYTGVVDAYKNIMNSFYMQNEKINKSEIFNFCNDHYFDNKICDLRLGECYFFGIGVERNEEKGIEYFDKSVSIDASLDYLIDYYFQKENIDKLKTYITKVYLKEDTNTDTEYAYAVCSYFNIGIPKDFELVEKILLKHANKCICDSMILLGAIYYYEEKYDLMFDLCQKITKIDPNENSPDIGQGIYLYEVKKDYDAAYKLFDKYAEYPSVQYYLGMRDYANKDYSNAFKKFTEASNNIAKYYPEYKAIQIKIAQCYMYGHGVECDLYKGMTLIRSLVSTFDIDNRQDMKLMNMIQEITKNMDLNINQTNMSQLFSNIQFTVPGNCCICFEKIENKLVYIPCGHTSTCGSCDVKHKIAKCPMCRTKIESRHKIYL